MIPPPLFFDPTPLLFAALAQPLPPPGTSPPGARPGADTGIAASMPGAPLAHPWRLAVQTESAFGVSGDAYFYNHLAGARLDHRFSETVSLGCYLGYVNLRGKQGRASNLLPYLMLEARPKLGGDFGLPLRWAPGYLPKNGPFMRFSAGVSLAASDSVDIVADLLAPTLWLTHDETVVSMDVALELAFAL